ncbi:MAG TPA: D-alanyl-D-alanine carboxypeptidase/D-alanyl-D-alanine-endopeptidase [Planctomycetota bacterium]|nr:D-alanyl-D-alanine carboxypeptidase/D-alanyl-D-alanine-endopeptidase [Planctomycetota bacterium]
MRRVIVCCVVLLVVTTGGRCARADLRGRIDAALAGDDAQRMTVGVRVLEMPTGKVLYSLRAEQLFIPASNVKIVTTASALHHLTPDFTFRTYLWADGTLGPDGTLRGDLVLQGDGDPNISGRAHNDDITYLPRTWAQMLHKRGFRHVTGDLVADDTLFDREYTCPSWPANQLHRWYAAPVAGLNFNDGCVDVVITPTRDGQPARVTLQPDTRYFDLTHELVTTSDASDARRTGLFLTRALGTNHIIVRGKIHTGDESRRYYVSVHEPPLYLATVLREEMGRAGITVAGQVRLAKRGRARVARGDPRVHIIHSSSLRESINVANKRSQSMYAEQILKRTGAACYGTGSFETGTRAAGTFLEAAGIRRGSYVLADGGGLSRVSRLSPMQLTEVLRHAWNAPWGRDFVDSLARSGIDKSLQKRLADAEYRGRIAAKTGTLDGVVTLSGYAFNRHGKVLAFSVLVNDSHNNWAVRTFTDVICRALVDEPIP